MCFGSSCKLSFLVCVTHKGPGSEPTPTNQYQEKNPKSDTDVAWDVWESNDGTAITLSNSKAREKCGRRGRKNMKTTGWGGALRDTVYGMVCDVTAALMNSESCSCLHKIKLGKSLPCRTGLKRPCS